jgi:hypothetical protein
MKYKWPDEKRFGALRISSRVMPHDQPEDFERRSHDDTGRPLLKLLLVGLGAIAFACYYTTH